MKRLWLVFGWFFTLSFLSLKAYDQDLLKASDIQKVMKQILDQHVDKKEVSTKIIQNAIITYFNQFDPYRIYLLEQEVLPFFHLSEQQLGLIIEQYKQNNFEVFREINQVIQEAIFRSRKLRQDIEQIKTSVLRHYPPSTQVFQKGMPYVRTIDELKERLLNYFIAFIETQKRRYGEAAANRNMVRLVQLYEEGLREFESQYLFQDDQGDPLSPAERESLFTIHILKALASSLDAHTTFYQANEAYDMRVRLRKEFQGVGIALKNSSEGIIVSRLLEGGPADRSGLILPGDILLEINGKSILDEPFDKVIDMLHSDKEPNVTFVFKRPAKEGESEKTFTVKLKRESIILSEDRVDVSSEAFGDGIIGKIALHSFYQGDGVSSEKDVREAIEKLERQGNLKGLILDLRDNSGGFLSQAVKVAGLFITNGIIVISKYADGSERFYRDVDSKVAYDGPLVVLTSRTTASAAEIVAQALQDYGVAIVVGDEQTYGKGTIQKQTVTDNKSISYFKVTVGKYYTVSGKTPQKEGVKADIIAPSRWSLEPIGEEYLDSANADMISSSYKDPLKDVSFDVKAWYLKYYMPTLQRPKTTWRKMIPALRENSEYRIKNNKNYQFYLKKGDKEEDEDTEEEDEWLVGGKKSKNYGNDDLQMQEAVNVVKDMVILHSLQSN